VSSSGMRRRTSTWADGPNRTRGSTLIYPRSCTLSSRRQHERSSRRRDERLRAGSHNHRSLHGLRLQHRRRNESARDLDPQLAYFAVGYRSEISRNVCWILGSLVWHDQRAIFGAFLYDAAILVWWRILLIFEEED
jgi:hypothetical protein